ncbi:DNA-directed RNA polymerase II subunit RPB7-like isoform X6 [Prosopis cineraria]|uniref:DNA-directed RNA polymerase II subunit RPB7-like isoform X6 n=1 Tax=Prosopis cineraria TaxID=364024 RepID=UPI00241077A9|nr:DNA-directed RNA polymerase II subunit RPB7-like isoform X6 [Prosopis cineraria]XP_054796016.1 DNA-directed RNA polymerase II subunit RPB7-like isoform X6 [Prosopis cineraria]XP_054796020.1 DNA-directed RNA polymerase II subunit RPB7-like isoform X6 [Prosopis cineraria]XP_054796027.1 DNA-directed RNA polymerase II subunit RPB7-like isoform X6 [Prosopis cineraria]
MWKELAVAVTGIESIRKGLIRDGTGFVTFPVKYQFVVFRPFKGEILEAAVTMVNKLIPDDVEFQAGDVPNYTTSEGSVLACLIQRIRRNEMLRFRKMVK